MKKFLITLTLALAAAIVIPATAQTTTNPEQKTACCKDKKACEKDGKTCAKDGKACNHDGKTCAKDGKACNHDGKACAKDGKACAKDGKACNHDGKACAKDGKACAKDGKACANEAGKACCKDGKKGMRKGMAGKVGRGERNIGGPKENGKMRRLGGENPLFKGITLTEDQQKKMTALREKNKADGRKAKADMKARSNDEMKKLRAEFDKEMEKILDKDQLKQYQANKADMEAKRAAKMNK